VYFSLETERDENGNYIPCIAEENTKGYTRTNWQWGKDIAIAQECADSKNAGMGISPKDAMRIQLSTMGTQVKVA